MALSEITSCINLFEALRNVFCLKVSRARADSMSYGSTSHNVDATSMESTSHVDPTPMESTSHIDPTPIAHESTSNVDPTPNYSRVAVDEGQWTDLPHDLLSRIASGLGFIDFLSFRCVCKNWHIASSKVSHEDKSSEFEPWFLIYGGEGSQC
ncbi:hypothetical protein VNO80_28774 [Phaseolus coccineus]|uniref:F-box domain-containing protein n=1 Tax=Phaseolus coccineus TaxID=3886 RepID=A0AAN9QHW1_PHACN